MRTDYPGSESFRELSSPGAKVPGNFRSRERKFSVGTFAPRSENTEERKVLIPDFLACIHCASSFSRVSLCVIVFYYMFMCVSCFGLVISTCQVIGYRKTPSDDTFMRWDYLHKTKVEECLCIFFFGLPMLLCVSNPSSPTQYIYFIRL